MKFTLKIFSLYNGELWLRKALLPHQIQNMMSQILCTKGFEAGLWKVEVSPYNEKTDREDLVGNPDAPLAFLGERTEFL